MVGVRRSPEEHWVWDEREAAFALEGAGDAIPIYQLDTLTSRFALH
jgi:hypothetical protein